MCTFLFWNYYCDQKVQIAPLFFFLVFAKIGRKRTRAKDQKQTIYFKRPYWLSRGILTKIGKGHGKVLEFGNWNKKSWKSPGI